MDDASVGLAILGAVLIISAPMLMLLLRKKTGSAALEEKMDDPESVHPMATRWTQDGTESPENERIRKERERKRAV
jgi:hypothetical protein